MKTTKNRKTLLLIISILILTALACLSSVESGDVVNQVDDSNVPDLEATTAAIQKTQEALDSVVVEVPVVEVPVDDTLDTTFTFYSDFSDLEDWIYYSRYEEMSNYSVDYFEPGINMYVQNPNDWISLYYNDIWEKNVRLEVEFEFINGPEDTFIEFYCRSNLDVETSFSISSVGYWEIGFSDYSVTPSEYTSLASGQSNLVDGLNFAVAYCEGEELSLYINEAFQGETTYPYVVEGDVGVSVLTFEDGPGEWFVSYFYVEGLN